MKRCFLFAFLFLCLFPCFSLGEALSDSKKDLSSSNQEVLSSLDLTDYENALSHAAGKDFSLFSLLSELLSGNASKGPYFFEEKIKKILHRFFLADFSRLPMLLLPAVLTSVIHRIRLSFSHAQAGEILEYSCFFLLCGMMLKDLTFHMHLCRDTVQKIVSCMQPLFPLLITLLTALGGTSGAAFYQPALSAAGGTMTALIRSFTLELAMGYGIVTLLSYISPRMHLKKTAVLLRKLCVWSLGISFTVFLSVTAVQGITASVADGVSVRCAKYAADHFVPVVGGMFADTMDTLIASSLLIKNALGITGLLAIFLILLRPLLKTLSLCILYKITAAVTEIFSPSELSSCAHDFSNVLTVFIVIELSAGAMFVLLIAQLLAAGNLIVMLR